MTCISAKSGKMFWGRTRWLSPCGPFVYGKLIAGGTELNGCGDGLIASKFLGGRIWV